MAFTNFDGLADVAQRLNQQRSGIHYVSLSRYEAGQPIQCDRMDRSLDETADFGDDDLDEEDHGRQMAWIANVVTWLEARGAYFAAQIAAGGTVRFQVKAYGFRSRYLVSGLFAVSAEALPVAPPVARGNGQPQASQGAQAPSLEQLGNGGSASATQAVGDAVTMMAGMSTWLHRVVLPTTERLIAIEGAENARLRDILVQAQVSNTLQSRHIEELEARLRRHERGGGQSATAQAGTKIFSSLTTEVGKVARFYIGAKQGLNPKVLALMETLGSDPKLVAALEREDVQALLADPAERESLVRAILGAAEIHTAGVAEKAKENAAPPPPPDPPNPSARRDPAGKPDIGDGFDD